MTPRFPALVVAHCGPDFASTRDAYASMRRVDPEYPPIDRVLFARLETALDDWLARLVACAPEDYDGPSAAAVRSYDTSAPISLPPVRDEPQPFAVAPYGPNDLANRVFAAIVEAHRDVLWLQWLDAAYAQLWAQNDACEANFTPIILADHRDVRWFVASSLFTWIASGVWTPPILRASLERLIVRAPSLPDSLRAMRDDPEPHTRWMSSYALEVLDGRWDRTVSDAIDALTTRYRSLIDAR